MLDIQHCLLAPPGTTLADVKVVLLDPGRHRAVPQFLAAAARRRGAGGQLDGRGGPGWSGEEQTPGVAAIGPMIAAPIYGLDVLAADIADPDGNQTRFVVVARDGVPAPTGHDKTSLVVYQRANEPGSLISILQEFAARRINLSRLESRPTKAGGLGDYCFVIDVEGHVADELVADCLRDLHTKQGDVKFLGSYPAAGDAAPAAREHADARWRQADDWVAEPPPPDHVGAGADPFGSVAGGTVAERTIAPALKAGGRQGSGVRIPPVPQHLPFRNSAEHGRM